MANTKGLLAMLREAVKPNPNALPFFQRPMTSGPGDYAMGRNELNQPIYNTQMGDAYTAGAPTQRGSVVRGILDSGVPSPSQVGSGILGVGRAIVEGGINGVTAPGRALSGETVTYGDVADTALDWGVMSAMPKVATAADPHLRRFAGDEYGGTSLNGSDFYHGSPDGRDVRAAGAFSDDKPVFMSLDRSTAATYADDTRAFDYQGADPEVFTLRSNPSRVLDVHAAGSDFHGIDTKAVRSGLEKAGVEKADIDAAIAGVRGRSDGKMSTSDLADISKSLGFEATDVHGVRDTYNNTAAARATTVRIDYNGSRLNIDGVTKQLSPAQQQAQDVLDMLKAGRGSEVTDEMLAAADDMYLFNNYDLPMDEASRMARAGDMGFDTDTPLYHGTKSNVGAFKTSEIMPANARGAGFYMTDSPNAASSYADGTDVMRMDVRGGESPNVMPVMARGRILDENAVLSQADVDAINPDLGAGYFDDAYKATGGNVMQETSYRPNEANEAIREAGYSGRTGGGIVGGGDAVIFDPSNIRSRFARFDPRLKHLANLSAGIGGIGILSQTTPEEIEAYLSQNGGL